MEDYRFYPFTRKERIICLLQGFMGIAVLGFLFYRSVFGVLFLSPLIWFIYKEKGKVKAKERRWQLNLEFRDGINSLAAALSAGYSVENAFEEALKDLKLLYNQENLIIREFTYLSNQIKINLPVEKALRELGERSCVEDIANFSEVFATAKRTGGDMLKIIKATCSTIYDKTEVKREIITLITAKRYEAKIMKLIPLGLLLFLTISSPGFLDPLYHNPFGIVIMTILLFLYIGANLLMNRMISIEI